MAEIKKMLSAQRDRMDNSYLKKRVWSLDSFNKYFGNHGLMSCLSRKLIWEVYVKGVYYNTILFHEGDLVDCNKEVIVLEDLQEVTIKLWHPINHELQMVLAWREFILDQEITQPFKQAYREVYILTDAEIKTETYSNRMAAHVLKQHQFNALSGVKNWSFSLMGAWDHGFDGIARKEIKEYNLVAEYWTQEINDGNMSESGIWSYVTTDQIRFSNKEADAITLLNIPKLVFSEVFRDVDMFVGVSSVGNDPEWADNGGLPNYRNYWQTYSFGDLSELAKTRKQILQNLVPRLKINKVAKIEGSFLIVEGKLRTYKIHIGSGNILMEPNDQYLCIVPDGKSKSTDKVYLPFEGDRTLSIVLSKAMLLAADDKIKDTTITSQINN